MLTTPLPSLNNVDAFLVTLNRLQPALKFTFEKERDGKLPFIDILMERTELGFETSVYRKPTQTENEPNRHAGTHSTYDMYKKQA